MTSTPDVEFYKMYAVSQSRDYFNMTAFLTNTSLPN